MNSPVVRPATLADQRSHVSVDLVNPVSWSMSHGPSSCTAGQMPTVRQRISQTQRRGMRACPASILGCRSSVSPLMGKSWRNGTTAINLKRISTLSKFPGVAFDGQRDCKPQSSFQKTFATHYIEHLLCTVCNGCLAFPIMPFCGCKARRM